MLEPSFIFRRYVSSGRMLQVCNQRIPAKEMSFDSRIEFWNWTIGRSQLSTSPLRVLWSTSYLCLLYSQSLFFLFRIGQLYSRVIFFTWKLRIAISRCFFSTTFPRLSFDCSDLAFLRFAVVARKLSMTGSIRIFEKIHLTPKLRCSYCSRSTSKYDRLAHFPRTQDRCPHRVLPSASESPEC